MENHKRQIYSSRIDFGNLVQTLREEVGSTQQQLAEDSGLPLRIVQDVEQGRRLDLYKGKVLIKLASGLQLTTLERQQFFFAASGISEQDFLSENVETMRSQFNSKEMIDKLKTTICDLRVPAFVTDSFCDVLLANKLVIEFLNVPQELLDEAKDESIIDGRNMMRLLFHPKSTYPSLIGKDWKQHALLNIRFFRRTSLRYRGNPYYFKLKRALEKYKAFRTYWKSSIAEVDDEYLSYATYNLDTVPGAPLQYFGTEVFLGITPYGELHMNLYLPLSNHTAQVFDAMYFQIGPSCEEFAAFPDRRKWNLSKAEKNK